MASANTELQSACTNGFACLDAYQLWQVIAQAYSTKSANATLVDACTNGLACLNRHQLLIVIAQILGG